MFGVSRRVGQHYESIAESLLVGLGYQLIERNYTCRGGEIDLICTDGEVLVFVEVRGRGSVERGYPEETVGWAKQQRIIRAAFAYLIRKRLGEPPCRFDVVGIDSSGARLYRDAFRVQS